MFCNSSHFRFRYLSLCHQLLTYGDTQVQLNASRNLFFSLGVTSFLFKPRNTSKDVVFSIQKMIS